MSYHEHCSNCLKLLDAAAAIIEAFEVIDADRCLVSKLSVQQSIGLLLESVSLLINDLITYHQTGPYFDYGDAPESPQVALAVAGDFIALCRQQVRDLIEGRATAIPETVMSSRLQTLGILLMDSAKEQLEKL